MLVTLVLDLVMEHIYIVLHHLNKTLDL